MSEENYMKKLSVVVAFVFSLTLFQNAYASKIECEQNVLAASNTITYGVLGGFLGNYLKSNDYVSSGYSTYIGSGVGALYGLVSMLALQAGDESVLSYLFHTTSYVGTLPGMPIAQIACYGI